MTDYEIDIREIKETLKKMQEDIKRLEDSIPFYPPTYQYSPDCFNTVPPTQATNYWEELKCQENWNAMRKWYEAKQSK